MALPEDDESGLSTTALIERATLAIGRLDAHVSASSAALAWQLRAAWTGYATALHMGGVEIDEIDVFSWGSGVEMPGRRRRETISDPFEAFGPWRAQLGANGRHWAEDLPFSLTPNATQRRVPLIMRALALQRAYLKADRSIAAWLALPILLHRLGMTETPLPCLVAGDRQLRFAPRDTGPAERRILRALETAAIKGRKGLMAIEDGRSVALAALAGEHRPTALRKLAALLARAPIQSPESISSHLGLTLSGAGKLLTRAAALGLVCEVSGRRAWRIYVVPDFAVTLGFMPAPKGRPLSRPAAPEPSRDVRSILDAFDRDMAEFEARFGGLAAS